MYWCQCPENWVTTWCIWLTHWRLVITWFCSRCTWTTSRYYTGPNQTADWVRGRERRRFVAWVRSNMWCHYTPAVLQPFITDLKSLGKNKIKYTDSKAESLSDKRMWHHTFYNTPDLILKNAMTKKRHKSVIKCVFLRQCLQMRVITCKHKS